MGEMTDKIGEYTINIKGDHVFGKQKIQINHETLGHIMDKSLDGSLEEAWFYGNGLLHGLIHTEEKLIKQMIDCTSEIIESKKESGHQAIIEEIRENARLLARFIKHGDTMNDGTLNPLSPMYGKGAE